MSFDFEASDGKSDAEESDKILGLTERPVELSLRPKSCLAMLEIGVEGAGDSDRTDSAFLIDTVS